MLVVGEFWSLSCWIWKWKRENIAVVVTTQAKDQTECMRSKMRQEEHKLKHCAYED